MDLLEIKSEMSYQEQNSESECTSPLDGTTNAQGYSRFSSFRSKIINGQIKLREKRGRSKVWNIFALMIDENGEEIENFVACRNCFNVYKYSSCTSNLVKHKCYINSEAKENGVRSSQDVEVDSETLNRLNDAAAQWLVTNCRSWTILEDSGLKNIARVLLSIGANFGENVNLDALMPSPTTIACNISELYESQRQAIAAELHKAKGIGYSITSSIWKDSYLKQAFAAVTVHYIQKSAMVSRLLAVSTFNRDSETGNHIGAHIQSCLRAFESDLDVDDPIIVTDCEEASTPASNCDHHVRCIRSLLNDAVEQVFKEVGELQQMLQKCISLSGKLTNAKSWPRSTHSNTILCYIKSVVDNWHLASEILVDKSEKPILIAEIKAVVRILLSFEQSFQAISEETLPTLHIIIPHLHKLKKVCSNNPEDISIASILKSALRGHLDTIERVHITKYHKIALFLFPPTKKLLLFEESDKRATIEECKRMMQGFYVESDNSRKRVKLDIEYCGDGIFSDFLEPMSSDTKLDIINNEINEYLSRKISLHEMSNVLEWWNANRVLFPLLYKVSCKILGTPASIAPSQRALRQARTLLSEQPMCIAQCAEDMINEIVFLSNNFKFDC